MKLLSITVGLLVCILTSGCIERQAVRQAKPFEVVELESCLGIMIDMSGSFATSWDDRAHKLFMQLLDTYFATGAGAESRVVIGQLSGSEQIVLFEGEPNELRRKFKSPDDLNNFLRANSDPSSSRVFESTRKMVDYVGSLNGITTETRLVTVILSDMSDNTQDLVERESLKEQLISSLELYRQRSGGLALYYVAQDEASRWKQLLGDAGFGPGDFVIETVLSESPQLPRLD